ncbi:hypothetical protein PILCRDRAFT_77628, partial [Piloderma croceum F 1598]
YRQARGALQRLSIDPEYVATLHDIMDDDLKVAGDLTDERRFGQRSDALPWFWRFGDAVDSGGLQMQECTYSYWPCALRAKAQFFRWSEELRLVEYEMQWTINWFRWKEGQWRTRLSEVDDEERPPGFDSYCHKQVALWDSLADRAQSQFSALLNQPVVW